MTYETSIKLDYESGNRLESHVAKWLMEQAEDYNDIEGIFRDLFHGGCQSGYVTHLIYSGDCRDFLCEYMTEIEALLGLISNEIGSEALAESFFKNDFSFDQLAWFGFERDCPQPRPSQ